MKHFALPVRIAIAMLAVAYVGATAFATFVTWRDLTAIERNLPTYAFHEIRDLRYTFADVVAIDHTLEAMHVAGGGQATQAFLQRIADIFYVRFQVFRIIDESSHRDGSADIIRAADGVQQQLDALVAAEEPRRNELIPPLRQANETLLRALADHISSVESQTDEAVSAQQGKFGDLKLRVVVSMVFLAALAAGVIVLLVLHRRANRRLRVAMNQDMLTGLRNRRGFSEWMEGADSQTPFALMVVDIDDFKLVNDRFGHAAGDRVLLDTAAWLTRQLPRDSIAARWGGDEFVAAWPTGGKSGAELRRGFDTAMKHPPRLLLEDTEAAVSFSIGMALWPADGATMADVLLNADLALYESKGFGKGRMTLFEPAIKHRRKHVDAIRDGLRRALDAGHLHMVWQPQVDLREQRMIGAEGLLRWTDPATQVPVPPSDFIPIAERSDLIIDIDGFVLDSTCRTLAACRRAGATEIRLSANVSARHFERATLSTLVADALARHGVPASALEIEMTEGVLLVDTPAVRANLADLARMGVRLALDDFGTGYSNIAYMTRVRPVILKIDRSFLRENDLDTRQSIIGGMLQIAGAIGADTLMEGVETEQDLAFLIDLGCRYAQGYLFARPMPADTLLAWRDTFEGSRTRASRAAVTPIGYRLST